MVFLTITVLWIIKNKHMNSYQNSQMLNFNRKEFSEALPRGFPLKMSTPNLFRGLNIKFRILIPKGQNETSKIPLWLCLGDSSFKKFFIAFTKTYAEKTKRAVFCQRYEWNKKRRNWNMSFEQTFKNMALCRIKWVKRACSFWLINLYCSI